MKFKKKKVEIATMPNLPEEILQEIFLRLPTRSLSRFKCVSKSFCALFRSRSFQILHNELSNIRNNTSIMFYEGDDIFTQFYMIDYKSVSALLPLSTSSPATMCEFINNWMDCPTIFLHCQVDFLSACNGLVWIHLIPEKWGDAEFYIWNPSTKVYKNIPLAPDVDNEDIDGYGFCYDYKIDNYKLIRAVINNDSKCSNVDVYVLGSNSWRSIQGIPYHLYHKRAFDVLFNGALHWLVLTFEKDFVLVRLDISNEIFEEVALPEALMLYLEQPLEENTFGIDVAVLGGCLCLVFHVYKVHVDIWTMQDYGARQSWTKSFSITLESITNSRYLELIWSFKNDEILWEVDQGVFVLYEPKRKICRKLVLGSVNKLYVARNYMVNSIAL